MNVCGERIRALRESMNYSQMKFAQIFDLGQSSVVRYEKGEASPLLASGAHSHFESGKFSQFWSEPGANPAR